MKIFSRGSSRRVSNAISDGKYLRWLREVGKLAELGRQPPGRYLGTVKKFEEARDAGSAAL